jgi:hypothetical protein
MRRYAVLMSDAMYADGRRSGAIRIVFRPWWRFFRGYVLRGGFLDGWRGLIYAYNEATYVRDKYVRLYLLNRGFKV